VSSAAHPETDRRAIRGQATRQRIIDAARDVLVAHGHAGTTTRAVADAAGVSLSQVHYHFGGRHGLLIEVLDRENDALLARQTALYSAPGPLSEKWRLACDFLDDDLRSGYVRVLWELWGAGLTDPELAAGWRAAIAGWRELLESVFTDWVADVGLELPITPRVMATLVANVFYGIEVDLLGGLEGPHREVLDTIGALIERAEAGLDYDALARGWASK
jgi:AcrR family transcriptional regulator